MKKLIAAICVGSVAVAFAEENATEYTPCDNTFGVLRVSSSAVRTIVAVPWLEPSTGGDEVHITNIVKTANLSAGDQVCYYDLQVGGFKVWELDSNKKWVAAQNVGDVVLSEKETLSRGNAFILMRENPADHFVIQGQAPKSATGGKVELTTSENKDVMNLLAPPTAEEFNLNSATWENVAKNDVITIEKGAGDNVFCQWRGDDGEFTGNNPRWRYLKEETIEVTFGSGKMLKKTNVWTDVEKMERGTGFWYNASARQDGKNPTVTW